VKEVTIGVKLGLLTLIHVIISHSDTAAPSRAKDALAAPTNYFLQRRQMSNSASS